MTERSERFAFLSPRNFWSVVALSIIILGVVAAYLLGVLQQLGISPPEIVSIPQEVNTEEPASSEEEESTPTQLPSPTPTDVPVTLTPTVAPTITETPAPTVNPTMTPNSTPLLDGYIEWDYNQRRDFISWGALEILVDYEFLTTLHCAEWQGRDHFKNADPFILRYLPNYRACAYKSVGDGITANSVMDEQLLDMIWSGEVELLDYKDPSTLAAPGNYFLLPSFIDESGEMEDATGFLFTEYLYDRIDIPQWEWALFVERNFRDYGWRRVNRAFTWEERAEWVKEYLELNYGIPGYQPYVPNFDPNSNYYMIESKRLGLGEFSETQTNE